MTDITRPQPLRWLASGTSHPGATRPYNEDAIFINDDLQLWLVADGMGGHQRGDLASREVVQALTAIAADTATLSAKVTQLEEALISANHLVCEYSAKQLQGAIVGSTLAGLILQGNLGFACWAGDSRLYRLRQGKLKCLTRDHSRLQELLDHGTVTADKIADHPEANIITRALGVERFLQLDMTLFSAQLGDSFLLCTDGLYNALSLEELTTGLGQADLHQACQGLLQRALSHQARDNVSAIVIRAQPRRH